MVCWFLLNWCLDVLTAPGMVTTRTGKDLLNTRDANKSHSKQQQNNIKKFLADEKATEKECVTEVYSGLRIR